MSSACSGRYTGAGVLIIAPSHTHTGELDIILGRNTRSGKYSDFGGFVDSSDASLAETASRELREETNGTIIVSARDLAKKGKCETVKEYASFCVTLEDVSCSEFYKSLKRRGAARGRGYGEIDRVTRFRIERLMAYCRTHRFGNHLESDTGEIHRISPRARAVIVAHFPHLK